MDEEEIEQYALKGVREAMGMMMRRTRQAEAQIDAAAAKERDLIVKFLRDFDPILAHAVNVLEHHKED